MEGIKSGVNNYEEHTKFGWRSFWQHGELGQQRIKIIREFIKKLEQDPDNPNNSISLLILYNEICDSSSTELKKHISTQILYHGGIKIEGVIENNMIHLNRMDDEQRECFYMSSSADLYRLESLNPKKAQTKDGALRSQVDALFSQLHNALAGKTKEDPIPLARPQTGSSAARVASGSRSEEPELRSMSCSR